MLKKIFIIFQRDLKSASRDSMAMYIIIMPILFALAITLFSPGLNDTTINIALLKSDDISHIEYMKQFAKVELFNNVEDIQQRINKRDDIVGMLQEGDRYNIILQGNETKMTEDYAIMLNALYEVGADKEENNVTMMSFERSVPPLKTMLVNMLISMTIMLAGMLIAISIVEEKADNTINALNVTPLSQTGYVIGKSLMGGVIAMISIILALIITGYYYVNWLMIILVGLTSLILSLIIGFIQGLASDDIIEAAANVKMIFLPIAGSIVGYELLSDKWQWTMYWSPFYWAYKANLLILSKTADWKEVLIDVAMVLILSLVVYFISLPKLRKGLS